MESLDQIIGINVQEMGVSKAQCTHAIAVLMLVASSADEKARQEILTCCAILASHLGVTAEKCEEIVRAGAADMGIVL